MNLKTVVILILALAAPVANATTGLTIQPVKISQTLEPGSQLSGTIKLSNASSEDVQLAIKVEDFVPLAGAEGLQFVGRAEGVTTVRDWISIRGDQSLIFKQGETRDITYDIITPPDAEPGSHFGVIFFKATRLNSAEPLKIGTQVGTLVFITVPGNRLQQGKILGFSAPRFVERGPVRFKIKFTNTGTVHFEPRGSIRISNLFGRKVGDVPIEGTAVLPSGVREWEIAWPNQELLLGRYTAAAAVLNDAGEVLTSANLNFYAAPIWWTVGFVLTMLIILFALRFLRRRVRISISLKD
ncbi:MAG: hypothetical protein HYT47_02470 [Candidatus Vogelbacteria bacterium]|nr:hypothetical protein [Candidatus Vogelbacteria bacterium]